MSLLQRDRGLLDGFRAGVPEALSKVYWAYVRKVEKLLSAGFEIRQSGIRVAGLCRASADLADLVQEVFLRAFSEKGRRGYDGLRDYGPYLYAIARNVLIDHVRSCGREVPTPWATIDATMDVSPVMENIEQWESPEVTNIVECYLGGLPAEIRDVHRLRHVEGLSQDEAARQLGIGRQALRTLERRLQEGLAEAIEAAGIWVDDQPETAQVRTGEKGLG